MKAIKEGERIDFEKFMDVSLDSDVSFYDFEENSEPPLEFRE